VVVFGPAAYGAARRAWAAWKAEREILRAGGAEAVAIVYRRMTRRLGRAGWQRDPAMTPGEYERWLAQAWNDVEPATGCVSRITERLVRASYEQLQDPSAAAEALAELERLRRGVPRRETAGSRWRRSLFRRRSPARSAG
jgi:hypothetical protein